MSIKIVTVLGLTLLLALLAWKFAQLLFERRAKAYEARRKHALIALATGEASPPPWAYDKERRDDFFTVVEHYATHKGTPSNFVQTALGTEVNWVKLLLYAGALEIQGASLTEQQLAVGDQIIEWWEQVVDMAARIEAVDLASRPWGLGGQIAGITDFYDDLFEECEDDRPTTLDLFSSNSEV